ncbi:MAG: glycosyltransferase [Acidobacteria bacterium]|nr:glycosyltransferase [Acidobacteriota bacterium]
MNQGPVFSVLIPTFGRADALAMVLQAWECQQPGDVAFEVVIVDDGSPDATRELLGSLRPQRFDLRRLVQENAGPAAARNRGLRAARGEIVLFTGDDIEPASDLLEQHLRGHCEAADSDVAILGLTRWPHDASVTATMRHIDGVGAQQFSYHWLEDGSDYDFRHFYTSNISVHRSLLDREPTGFSEDFPAAAFEDAEYAYRLAGHGLRIRYRASAVAFHHHPYNTRSFFERQRRCGRMAALLWEKQPALAKWLSIRDFEAIRLRAASLPADRRAVVDRFARDLELWEGHAFALAGFYDSLDPSPRAQDDLLHTLFRFAFLKGLGEGLLEPHQARSTAAAAFLALMPPAAKAYRVGLESQGLPCPAEDAEKLIGLIW